jgi:gluconokinase
MNPNLLKSQLDTLEPPSDALRIVNDRSPDEVVDRILSQLSGTKTKQ